LRYLLLIAVSFTYLFANAHIFVYHRFADDRHPSTNTTIAQLESQFQYFQKNGYIVVPIEKIIEKVSNKQDIPDNWVALTIDDSFKSFYENGFPIFKKYNYPFSIFVYVKATQKKYKDFMNWEELKEVSKYGTIGHHSYGHQHMTTLSAKEVFEDTLKANNILKAKLGIEPKIYVYPYGEYDQKVAKEISKFNFDAILNQTNGSVNRNSDVMNINRIALVGKVNLKQKLKYKTLEAIWLEPKIFPKDSILKKIKVKVNPKYKTMKIYVTGDKWKDIKVKNGIIDEILEIPLKKNRTRVIISPDYYTVSTKLIIKNK